MGRTKELLDNEHDDFMYDVEYMEYLRMINEGENPFVSNKDESK